MVAVVVPPSIVKCNRKIQAAIKSAFAISWDHDVYYKDPYRLHRYKIHQTACSDSHRPTSSAMQMC